jgi:hypothetical protein
VACGNVSPRQESQFHKTARVIGGKIDVLEDGDFVLGKVEKRAVLAIATELQHFRRPASLGATTCREPGHQASTGKIITGY